MGTLIGNVGIGTTGPSDELHVAGQIYTTTGLHIGADSDNNLFDDASNRSGSTTMYIGNASINVTASDVRLKENVVGSEVNALELIAGLDVVDFDWREGNKWAGRGRATGLIAQEVYEYLPQVVDRPEDEESTWSVEYHHLVPYLVKGVQELASSASELDQVQRTQIEQERRKRPGKRSPVPNVVLGLGHYRKRILPLKLQR